MIEGTEEVTHETLVPELVPLLMRDISCFENIYEIFS